MRLGSLAVNQLSQEGFDWLLRFLSAVDAKDPYVLGAQLAERSVLRTNSDPPTEGRGAILSRVGYLWSSFRTLEHEPLNIYGADRAFALEALNHYTRTDTTPVTLRAVTFIDRDESGLVTSIRLYTDTTALYIRARRPHPIEPPAG
jgi:hypothetical protein